MLSLIASNNGDANNNNDNNNNNNHRVFNNNGKHWHRKPITITGGLLRTGRVIRNAQPNREDQHQKNNHENNFNVVNNNDNKLTSHDIRISTYRYKFRGGSEQSCPVAGSHGLSDGTTSICAKLNGDPSSSLVATIQPEPSTTVIVGNRINCATAASLINSLRTYNLDFNSLRTYNLYLNPLNTFNLYFNMSKMSQLRKSEKDWLTYINITKSTKTSLIGRIGCRIRDCFDKTIPHNENASFNNRCLPNCAFVVDNRGKSNPVNIYKRNNSKSSISDDVKSFKCSNIDSCTSFTAKTANSFRGVKGNSFNSTIDKSHKSNIGTLIKYDSNLKCNITKITKSHIVYCSKSDVGTKSASNIGNRRRRNVTYNSGRHFTNCPMGGITNALTGNIAYNIETHIRSNQAKSNANNNHVDMVGDEEEDRDDDYENLDDRLLLYIYPPFENDRENVFLKFGDTVVVALAVLVLVLIFVVLQYWKDSAPGGGERLLPSVDRNPGHRARGPNLRRRPR